MTRARDILAGDMLPTSADISRGHSLDRDIESRLRIKASGFACRFQYIFIVYILFPVLEVEVFLRRCNNDDTVND